MATINSINNDIYLQSKIILTSSQVNSLNTTPVLLVSPLAEKIIVPVYGYSLYTYNGTVFGNSTNTGRLTLGSGGTQIAQLGFNSLALTGTTNLIVFTSYVDWLNAVSQSSAINSGIYIGSGGANTGGGLSTITVFINYYVITV